MRWCNHGISGQWKAKWRTMSKLDLNLVGKKMYFSVLSKNYSHQHSLYLPLLWWRQWRCSFILFLISIIIFKMYQKNLSIAWQNCLCLVHFYVFSYVLLNVCSASFLVKNISIILFLLWNGPPKDGKPFILFWALWSSKNISWGLLLPKCQKHVRVR